MEFYIANTFFQIFRKGRLLMQAVRALVINMNTENPITGIKALKTAPKTRAFYFVFSVLSVSSVVEFLLEIGEIIWSIGYN